MDEIRKITHELAKIDEGKVKAIAEGDKVYLMIQDAPAELRRLADALEQIDVREIKALVAYAKPGGPKKPSARVPKTIETIFPASVVAVPVASPGGAPEPRVQAVLERFRPRVRKLGGSLELGAVADGVVSLRLDAPGSNGSGEIERLRDELRKHLERDLPGLKRVEFA